MDLTPIAGVLVGLVAAWLLFIALLWVLRPRDARLGDLVRVVPDILRLCRDVLADRAAPLGPRLAIAGLLVWLVSPIDLPPSSARSSVRSTTWSSRSSCRGVCAGDSVRMTCAPAGAARPRASRCRSRSWADPTAWAIDRMGPRERPAA